MAAFEDYQQLLAAAVEELRANTLAAEPAAGTLVAELAVAADTNARIAVHGVGREGLAMKGFAMRLFHMGLQVSGCWVECVCMAACCACQLVGQALAGQQALICRGICLCSSR